MTGACLLALAGCVVSEAPRITAPVTIGIPTLAVPTSLSAEAEAALQAAEQSVTEARVKRALWTAAVDELGKARMAAKAFDSTATLVHAKEVVALCALAVQQLSAAPVKW